MTLIIYSHSSYKDVLEICLEQLKKFGNSYKTYTFLDKDIGFENTILYNESFSYPERVYSCLQQVQEKAILFQHEDMILYSSPDYNKLKKYFSFVEKDKVDSIKLIKGGGIEQDLSVTNDLHSILPSHPNMFAVQPTIWNKEKLEKVLKAHFGLTIWQMETNANKFLIDNKYRMLYSYVREQDKKRGLYHYDSSVYPYIATAICKGKWNLKEYPELQQVLKDYKIDWKARGQF